jgi:hypothetical protein
LVHEGDLAAKSFEMREQRLTSLIGFPAFFHQAKELPVIDLYGFPALGVHFKMGRETFIEKNGFFGIQRSLSRLRTGEGFLNARAVLFQGESASP